MKKQFIKPEIEIVEIDLQIVTAMFKTVANMTDQIWYINIFVELKQKNN